ncbi:protein vac14 homolog [Plakobranchus ocellatus]|uniref:Protein vac14 homolog n=1 Tax=Plakobranchus ocellatus TaxID=259542 RepID=A0AAV4CKZ7_9GAST|nr:protein vac14 homolog [Plakobranchus ocellatus]
MRVAQEAVAVVLVVNMEIFVWMMMMIGVIILSITVMLKDIVTESSSFDLVAFVPLLNERIYTRNPFAIQFVDSWIKVLDAVPDINVLVLLPEILDGFFQILGDNSNEIRKMCQNVLAEFLEDDLIQFTAISWLREFILLAGRSMLPHVIRILNSVLPCLSYSDEGRKSSYGSTSLSSVNSKVSNTLGFDPAIVWDDQPTPTVENVSLQTHIDSLSPAAPEADAAKNSSAMIQLEIPSVIKVLQRLLGHETIQTRVAALKWFNLLLVKTPNKTFRHIDDFFDLLMTTLADPSDDVVLLDLEVLSQISSNPAGFGLPDNKTVHQSHLARINLLESSN